MSGNAQVWSRTMHGRSLAWGGHVVEWSGSSGKLEYRTLCGQAAPHAYELHAGETAYCIECALVLDSEKLAALQDGLIDRYVSPEPEPDPHQRELLTILIEECAEVQKRATKIMRFGIEEKQPGQSLTNRQRLSLEIGDLVEMIALVTEAGLVQTSLVQDGRVRKRRQLAKYLQNPKEQGAP